MEYVIAVRRECREAAPPDLLEEVAVRSDVQLIGSIMFGRMIIQTDKPTIDQIRDEYGDLLHIEPKLTYSPRNGGKNIEMP